MVYIQIGFGWCSSQFFHHSLSATTRTQKKHVSLCRLSWYLLVILFDDKCDYKLMNSLKTNITAYTSR